MQDLVRYLAEIVVPTVRDFEDNPTSRRHAFLACIVVFHAVDYVERPEKHSRKLREKWGLESPDFAEVDRVAHAFKHKRTNSKKDPLNASTVVSRPPAIAGIMVAGLSQCGDITGAVVLMENTGGNLLAVVRRAAAFVHTKAHVQSEASNPYYEG